MRDLVHNCLNEVLRGLAHTVPVLELLNERKRIEAIEQRWRAGTEIDREDFAMLARIVRVVAEELGQSEFHTRVGAALHEAHTAIELLEQLSDPSEVWVFQGGRGALAGGVFSSRKTAERWIARNRVSGLLTRYTLDVAAYDWSIANRMVIPSRTTTPEQIACFSGGEVHFHYEAGELA